MDAIAQKLLFVLGKGGVGRTTCAMALATVFAEKGERVLIVQWALQDAISPQFGRPGAGHSESLVSKNISTMNFDVDEAMREYFVDHLRMRLLHSVVIENKHVQRLIHAAPGVQELFFLGRLFWLIELAQEERGWSYDRVIVDTPATGHGVSLFTIAPTIASFGMTGPLAHECDRVSRLLADTTKVGTILVTLPEELPVEETLESLPKLQKELGRLPLMLLVNKSISRHSEGSAESLLAEEWYAQFSQSLSSDLAREGARLLLGDLLKRNTFEQQLEGACEKLGVPLVVLSDAALTHPERPEEKIPAFLATELRDAGVAGRATP